MKTSNQPQSTTRVSRFSKVSQKHGLIVVLLVLATLLFEFVNPILSSIFAITSLAALIYAFVSGYKRSDELEQLVQLKSAAISFILVIFVSWVLYILNTLGYATSIVATDIVVLTGFLSHLLLLPQVAKRTYEK